jgi:alkyl hydroperoxide reductase subunit F
MLDLGIKNQLNDYLKLLEDDINIKLSIDNSDKSRELEQFIGEIKTLSPKISVEKVHLERTPSFSINKEGDDTGVTFAGIPLGHEFSSLVLALLQVGGRAPKIESNIIDQIKNIKDKLIFTTYVSLTCQICPDVVQALNVLAVLNPNITHTTVDGSIFRDEVEEKKIFAVPTVYLNGELFSSGRISIEEILAKLGTNIHQDLSSKQPYDVLIIGGGPAGVSAAIYSARKGIRTGVVAENIGGQILDTLAIENLISMKYTEGPKLASLLEDNLNAHAVDIIKGVHVKEIKQNKMFYIALDNNQYLQAKTIIIATGAKWRNINVPGEAQFKNKGVAYCPHCDGPLFANKPVAVIGGGNSGVEVAIDLANTSSHVTVIEFLPQLKADKVLQDKLNSLKNVTVIKNAQTKEITGTDKVNGLTYIDRTTNEQHHFDVDGVFVQIGLVPNTDFVGNTVERNRFGEIIVDTKGATNVPGIFAAGDCTNSPFKQIIISMGSGATAALSAFEYLMINVWVNLTASTLFK